MCSWLRRDAAAVATSVGSVSAGEAGSDAIIEKLRVEPFELLRCMLTPQRVLVSRGFSRWHVLVHGLVYSLPSCHRTGNSI